MIIHESDSVEFSPDMDQKLRINTKNESPWYKINIDVKNKNLVAIRAVTRGHVVLDKTLLNRTLFLRRGQSSFRIGQPQGSKVRAQDTFNIIAGRIGLFPLKFSPSRCTTSQTFLLLCHSCSSVCIQSNKVPTDTSHARNQVATLSTLYEAYEAHTVVQYRAM